MAFIAPNAFAEYTISQTVVDEYEQDNSGIGQSFTTESCTPAWLCSISVYIETIGNDATITVYEGAGVEGSVVYSHYFDEIPPSTGWNTYYFNEPPCQVPLNPNAVYTFEITGSNATYGVSSNDLYAGGSLYIAGVEDSSRDMAFELQICCDTCYDCLDPWCTLIELSSFTASYGPENTILQWQTATEMDNAGFHIWRKDSEDGEAVRITDALIPAEGNEVTGASYAYVDETASGTDFIYMLEDIDYSGKSSFHDLTSRRQELEDGWNILNGQDFEGLSVAGALSSIRGQYGSVWGLTDEGWKMYDPVRETFSNLETFEAPYDYWIHMVEAATLDLP